MKRTAVAFAALALMAGLAAPPSSCAEVSVNVQIGPPPAYVFPGPPQVIAIPGTYVYLVPGIAVEILFFQGYWYRPYEGHWFRSRSYNGPWHYHERVPAAIVGLPPNYYHAYREPPPEYRRVPYGQVKKNWGAWERNRYWEQDEYWRRGREHGREEHGRGQEKGHGHGH